MADTVGDVLLNRVREWGVKQVFGHRRGLRHGRQLVCPSSSLPPQCPRFAVGHPGTTGSAVPYVIGAKWRTPTGPGSRSRAMVPCR